MTGGDFVQKILVNKIKCNKCGDIIESIDQHDFKFCKCGACAVDGGKDYLRRCGNREDWEELSEYESILASREEDISECTTYVPDEEW